MNLGEMIALYREQSYDKAEPYFCSDEVLTIYANEGQDEACRRGELLRDSSSTICTVSFLADAESIPLDSKVVHIKSARVDGHPVTVVNDEFMNSEYPNWMTDPVRDRPTMLVEGVTTGRAFLWPRPKDDGTVRMTVQRLPLEKLVNDTDEPEIRPELHFALVDWMLYRAHSREDQEIFNDTKAALAKSRFEAEFGRKASGRNEAWARYGARMNAAPIA